MCTELHIKQSHLTQLHSTNYCVRSSSAKQHHNVYHLLCKTGRAAFQVIYDINAFLMSNNYGRHIHLLGRTLCRSVVRPRRFEPQAVVYILRNVTCFYNVHVHYTSFYVFNLYNHHVIIITHVGWNSEAIQYVARRCSHCPCLRNHIVSDLHPHDSSMHLQAWQ